MSDTGAGRTLGIGDEMHFQDSRGRCFVGLILNMAPARLIDIDTDEVYAAQKFYLWNEKLQRGRWTCAMRPSAPLPKGKAHV